jgi:cytochrome c biogenesis protein CcdA
VLPLLDSFALLALASDGIATSSCCVRSAQPLRAAYSSAVQPDGSEALRARWAFVLSVLEVALASAVLSCATAACAVCRSPVLHAASSEWCKPLPGEATGLLGDFSIFLTKFGGVVRREALEQHSGAAVGVAAKGCCSSSMINRTRTYVDVARKLGQTLSKRQGLHGTTTTACSK